MEDKEKATPVTPDEIEDIRVTLDLDEGEVECKILTIFEVNKQDYIALMPLNPDGSDPDEGTVYLYRYAEDEDGIPQIDSITDDDEYEALLTASMKCSMMTTSMHSKTRNNFYKNLHRIPDAGFLRLFTDFFDKTRQFHLFATHFFYRTDGQGFLCSGHSHIKQTPFFLDILL